MMLNKKEKVLMKIIFDKASEKNGQAVLAPIDILSEIPVNVEFKEQELQTVMYDLSLEGYFTYTEAKKKNDDVYVITLAEKGLAYKRDMLTARKKLIIRLAITAAVAGFSFLVSQILRWVFN